MKALTHYPCCQQIIHVVVVFPNHAMFYSWKRCSSMRQVMLPLLWTNDTFSIFSQSFPKLGKVIEGIGLCVRHTVISTLCSYVHTLGSVNGPVFVVVVTDRWNTPFVSDYINHLTDYTYCYYHIEINCYHWQGISDGDNMSTICLFKKKKNW